MKKFTASIASLVLSMAIISAQEAPPRAFSYKAAIKKAYGNPVCRKAIALKISILRGSEDGVAVYTEYFKPVTNDYGQIDLIIGSTADLSVVDWQADKYFLRTEVDDKGGSNYEFLSCVQLLSVPYSLYAGSAGNGFASKYTDGEMKPVLDEDGNVSLGKPDAGLSKLNVDGNLNVTGEILKNGVPLTSDVKLAPGQNVSITGTGSTADPYVISSSSASQIMHYPGELFGGGIVFWVDNTGEHGLIASLQNFSTLWSNVPDALGTNDNSSWNGLYNSGAIAAQPGFTNGAAKYCLDLSSGGFNDWYLPAADQLNLLFNSKYVINKVLASDNNNNTQPLMSTAYWSSTEYIVPFMASVLSMLDGTTTCLDKSAVAAVRAIREF